MVAWRAIALCAAVGIMLWGLSSMGRFDAYMRKIGLGRLMTGSRTYAVSLIWAMRIAVLALGVFGLVSILRDD